MIPDDLARARVGWMPILLVGLAGCREWWTELVDIAETMAASPRREETIELGRDQTWVYWPVGWAMRYVAHLILGDC